MAPNTKIFSLEGKGLKLDTKDDVEAHIKDLRAMEDVEEIRLLGNTLGVEACKVLGEVLETKKTLQVMLPRHMHMLRNREMVLTKSFSRLQIWQTYLPDDYLTRFPKHFPTFLPH
jgi:Ran GTPase-activating protein (RanGAP) involved in mRNA processing and transport